MKKNELKLVENYSEGQEEAVIRLNRPISNDPNKGITGPMFSAEFDFLVNMGVKKILIPINSTGGNVFNGMEIYSTISDSPIETETRVVGIAASMAGIISQAGTRRTIKKQAMFHAHAPRAEAGKSVSDDLLSMSYNSIKSLLKGTSGISEEKADEILSKESFFEAKEAADLGFFDAVLEPDGEEVVPEITNEMSDSEIMDVFNSIENHNDKFKKMEKVNSLLGLSNDANEASALEKINGLKASAAKVQDLENEIVNKDEKIVLLENQIAEANKAKAQGLIENAIQAGKISEEGKALWIENAERNFEVTSKMLEGLKSSAKSEGISNQIEQGAGVENRKEWDFKKWSKEDPQGLENLRINNSAEFDRLLEEYTK